MRVALRGINRVRKKLKGGQTRTYYYAWKGGPRLLGDPGSPEFMAGYHEAIEARRRQPDDTIAGLISHYSASTQFADLARSTRRDYARHMLCIEREFGELPLAALEDKRIRGEFMAWRDRLAAKSRRQADYAFAVLARILSWSRDRGLIKCNPCERGGRVYRAERNAMVWSEADEAAVMGCASPQLQLALQMALWTGQRQGDLLKVTWSAFDGDALRLRQGKSKARVEIPVARSLIRLLEPLLEQVKLRRPDDWRNATILETSRGESWTEGGFRASWRKAVIAAGVEGLSFHDLRGTAVTRLAHAGCSVPEIATITGHSLKDVGSILDSHYLHRSVSLAKSAMAKLERRYGR